MAFTSSGAAQGSAAGPDEDCTKQTVDVRRLVLDNAYLLHCFQEDKCMELSACMFCKYTIASFQLKHLSLCGGR